MGTKELAFSMIEQLSAEQLEALVVILKSMKKANEHSRDAEVDALFGIMHDVANPDLIPLEETAWVRAAVEKHRKQTQTEEEQP